MSLVINTNVASLNAQRSLQSASELNKTAMERLSSGKKSTVPPMTPLDLRLSNDRPPRFVG